MWRLALAAVALTAIAPSTFARETVRAPFGLAPAVDGKLDEREWADALRLELGGGGELYLKHDGTRLYVGICSSGSGIASLGLLRKPGRVSIAHASAALGTAEYERSGESWKMVRTFAWSNRDTGTSAEAVDARKRFFAAEGWFANASRTASTEREYEIDLTASGVAGVPLAVVFMSFPDEKLRLWPSGLADGAASPDLVKGNTPEGLRFDPESWAVVVPAPRT